MKKIFLSLSIISILVACSADSSHETEVQTTQVQAQDIKIDKILSMEVSGMVCKMGCGGAIRKDLKSIEGVSMIEFVDFNEENEFNVAKVYFSSEHTSADAIKGAVGKINDGQFTIGECSEEAYINIDSGDSGQDGTADGVSVSSKVETLNLFDFLVDLVM